MRNDVLVRKNGIAIPAPAFLIMKDFMPYRGKMKVTL